MRRHLLASTTAISLLIGASPAFADIEAARAFLDAEIGDMSSLTREEQEAEMQWFIDAAQPFQGMDIKTVEGADNMILAMDAALTQINTARADMGAVQNRFTSVIANLSTSIENLSAARSRIQDADFAKESAQLSRNQILQQAGTAMLAQANQATQSVLQLLR